MREQARTVRLSEPDPLALMDVLELIAPEARVTGWRALPGGIAHAMHRIEVTMPSGAQTAFVLRRGIPELGFDSDVASQAATLEGLRDTLVAAPELLWLDAEGAVFGRPAMAMTVLPGRPQSRDALTDPAVVGALAEALVSLSWVTDLTPFSHLDIVGDAESLLASIRGVALPPVPFADAPVVRDALVAALPDLQPTSIGLCHGDFHIGNVLFDGHRATGIVDWDSARLTDPRTDLAYAAMDLAIIGGLDVGDALIREYEALKGPVPDRDWWCLRATIATWSDVAEWLPGWHELGIDIDVATVYARLRAWTERHLDALTG